MRMCILAVACSLVLTGQAAHSERQGDANLLFVNALESYENALAADDAQQRELLQKVDALLSQIREEYPESIPAQFMAEGKSLGGIDLTLVEASTEELPVDKLDQSMRQRLDSIIEVMCGSNDRKCLEQLQSATSEFLVRVLLEDMKAIRNIEAFRWLFTNPGRFDDNQARVTAFSEMLEDEAFMGELVERLDQKLLGEFAREALSDFAFGIVTGLTADVLADYYESQGEQAAADFTRTWMEPLVESSALALSAGTATIGTASAGAAVIWAQNAYGFVNLGKRHLEAERSGATKNQQLETIATQIDSLTRSLLTRRVTGPMFSTKDQGAVVDERLARAFEEHLAQLYELQTFWLSSNDAILLDTFDFVLEGARNTYLALLSTTQPSGTESANSTNALPGDIELKKKPASDPESSVVFGIPDGQSPVPTDQLSANKAVKASLPMTGDWIEMSEARRTIRIGETADDMSVAQDGSARYRGEMLFAAASTPDATEVRIFSSPVAEIALVMQWDLDTGGVRAALINLGTQQVLNSNLVPETAVLGKAAANDVRLLMLPVAWSPDGKYAAMPLSSKEWQADLLLIDVETGNQVVIQTEHVQPGQWTFPKFETLRWKGDDWASINYDVLACADADCTAPEVVGSISGGHRVSTLLKPSPESSEEVSVEAREWGPRLVAGVEVGYYPCRAPANETDACLRALGLSNEAISFSFESDGDYSGSSVGTEFRELGAVDLATRQFIGNTVYYTPILLNGPLGFHVVPRTRDLAGTFRDATSQQMLQRFPRASNIGGIDIRSHRRLPDGTQRFTVVEIVNDGCRACEILGNAVSFLEIGPATGNRLVRRPIGLLLGDPADSVEMTAALIRSRPESLQVSLNTLGYDAGEMDGFPGPQTRSALMEFQVEHCLTPTGQPDPATANALLRADGFEAPCAGAQLPEGLDANTPLLSGIYVDDPALCSATSAPYETVHLQQRIVRGRSITWGHEGGCETRRTDIRDGVTLFRGTCSEGNQSNESRWRFDVESNESFIDLDMPTAIPRDAAPRRFTRCPDNSTLRSALAPWFGDAAPRAETSEGSDSTSCSSPDSVLSKEEIIAALAGKSADTRPGGNLYVLQSFSEYDWTKDMGTVKHTVPSGESFTQFYVVSDGIICQQDASGHDHHCEQVRRCDYDGTGLKIGFFVNGEVTTSIGEIFTPEESPTANGKVKNRAIDNVGPWLVAEEPQLALRIGEQGRGFSVSEMGTAYFEGQQLFGDYKASEPDIQRLLIFVDKTETRAIALFMLDGAERIALVDLESRKVLNDEPVPIWIYGPSDGVYWDPAGKFAALRLPMAEYSTGIGIFDLETGKYAVVPDGAFNADASESWLAKSLATRADGKVFVNIANQNFDEHGSPLPSDDAPLETRVLDLTSFFPNRAVTSSAGGTRLLHSQDASETKSVDQEVSKPRDSNARLAQYAKEIAGMYENDRQTMTIVANSASYAELANLSYDTSLAKDQIVLTGKWRVADTFEADVFGGIFSAVLFVSDDGERVLAFRGTDSASDWLNNFGTPFGVLDGQSNRAADLVDKLIDQYPNLKLTGHSLGGRLAQTAAARVNRPAIVFDSAPLSTGEVLLLQASDATVLSFRAEDDMVSALSAVRDVEVKNFPDYDHGWLKSPIERGIVDHDMSLLAGAMTQVKTLLPYLN